VDSKGRRAFEPNNQTSASCGKGAQPVSVCYLRSRLTAQCEQLSREEARADSFSRGVDSEIYTCASWVFRCASWSLRTSQGKPKACQVRLSQLNDIRGIALHQQISTAELRWHQLCNSALSTFHLKTSYQDIARNLVLRKCIKSQQISQTRKKGI